MPIFTVNTSRFDPYKSYRFLVYFGASTAPWPRSAKSPG